LGDGIAIIDGLDDITSGEIIQVCKASDTLILVDDVRKKHIRHSYTVAFIFKVNT